MPQVLNFLRAGTSFDPEQLAAIGAAFDLIRSALNRANIQCSEDVIAAEMIGVASAGACEPRGLSIATLKILGRHRQVDISQAALEQAHQSLASPVPAAPLSARAVKRS